MAQALQLHLVDDTALREDPRLAVYSSSSSVAPGRGCAANHQSRAETAKYSSSSSVLKPDPRITRINKIRRGRNISHDALCRDAGASLRNWFRLVRGEQMPTDGTIARLEAALDTARESKPPQVIAGFHRIVMRLIAEQMNFDVVILLATDFSKQRPGNPQWLRAARIRQMASYITAVELEVSNVDLGRAIGDTRANIKYARDAIEDLREEGSEIERVLAAVTLQVRG